MDVLIYLLAPDVPREADLIWRPGGGTVCYPLGGGAYRFGRLMAVRYPDLDAALTIRAQLAAFPTSTPLALLADECRARDRNPTPQPLARRPLLARVPASPIPSTGRAVWPVVAAVVLC